MSVYAGPDGGSRLASVQRCNTRKHGEETPIRILFLTQICPYPPTNGGAIKTYNILKHLAARHEVTLLTFTRRDSESPALEHLSGLCHQVEACRIPRSARLNALAAASSILHGTSFIVTRDHRGEMARKVEAALEKRSDLIYVDHLQMFQYVPPSAPCPVLLDEHNVEWRIVERFARGNVALPAKLFGWMEWPKLRRYELSACRRADRVLTVTGTDAETLIGHGIPDGKIAVLPIGVDIEYFQPLPLQRDARRIVTFGTMSWPPNIDAVSHFHRFIYPLVRRRITDVRFSIIGASPPQSIVDIQRSDPSVEVTGFVDDIRRASLGASVFVVPLRIGSGMRVKILDAMAMGLPVVSTSIGCEGISVRPGEHVVVADSPQEFASAVVDLLESADKRERLAKAARAFVESEYSWPSLLPRLDAVLARLAVAEN